MYKLWNGAVFPKFEEMSPIKNIEYANAHTAIEGEYQFLLGAAIIKHKSVLYASWGNSLRNENDDNTILAGARSYDGGKTWVEYERISKKDKGFGRSHGVFFEHSGRLYAFCPKAKYDKIDAYPDLKTEGYLLNDNGVWECLGIVIDNDFWPMCEPIYLDNGNILMAGLKSDGQAAVAICAPNDLTKWEMKTIPNPNGIEYWGETTVLKYPDRLLAIIRKGKDLYALVSESYDNGVTWSGIEESNFKITSSKMYAGNLSNGKSYLVFSSKVKGYRDTMCIAIGKEGFDKSFIIRHGFDKPPRFWKRNEWSYPYAYEDKETQKLYVAYAKNKEDCEVAIIPIESLE